MNGNRCLIELFDGGTSVGECHAVATTTYWGACVHEHVDRGVACDQHAENLVTDYFSCAPCREVDGHECQFVFGVEALV